MTLVDLSVSKLTFQVETLSALVSLQMVEVSPNGVLIQRGLLNSSLSFYTFR